MSKESTKLALDKFFSKQAKKSNREMNGGPKKSNGRPEFEQTVKPCFKWLEAHGFSMSIVESRAVYSEQAGRYVDGQTENGFSDSAGCCPDGLAAFIEFKAPGKRSNVSPAQYQFLKTKLELGCFAIVADSVESLAVQWNKFIYLRTTDRQSAINYLQNQLPVPPIFRQRVTASGELPF